MPGSSGRIEWVVSDEAPLFSATGLKLRSRRFGWSRNRHRERDWEKRETERRGETGREKRLTPGHGGRTLMILCSDVIAIMIIVIFVVVVQLKAVLAADDSVRLMRDSPREVME